MSAISDKLFEVWTDHLKSVLDSQKIDTTSLTTHDPQRIALAYLTWEKKKITALPRQVLKAANFTCPIHLESQLQDITRKFECGENLNGYLSARVNQLDKHDYLLYDWGIHHLHFDDHSLAGVSRKRRSSELLFVFVTTQAVHLLAILDHYSFSQQKLIEILDENWPEVTASFCIDMVFQNKSISASDRAMLRKAHINAPVVLAYGKGFLSSGIACSGDSSDVVDEMIAIQKEFDLLGEYLDFFISGLDAHPIKLLFNKKSDFGLVTVYDQNSQPRDYGVVDSNTGKGATLSSLLRVAKEWDAMRFSQINKMI